MQRRIIKRNRNTSTRPGRWTTVIILVFMVLITSAVKYGLNRKSTIEKREFIMDTFVSIKASGIRVKQAIELAFEEIRRIDDLFSLYKPDTEIDRINAQADGGYVTVSNDTLLVLKRVREFYWMTEGAFDGTIAPLARLWGFDSGNYKVPTSDAIQTALKLVGFDKVLIDEVQSGVRFERSGMSLDLGGAGKGYATDKAYDALKESGVDYAFISVGTSSIRVLGSKPDGTDWRVGIGHPRNPSEYFGVILLKPGEALGTSGDYQQYFEEDGIRYSHIIDPRTGLQPRELLSVTVLAGNALDADILSTAIFVLGVEKGMELVEELDGVEAVLFTADEDIFVSSGIKDRFVLQMEGKKP